MFIKNSAFGLACIATACLSVLAKPVEVDRRATMVKDAFLHAWTGYSTHAFGHDELRPVTNGTTDSRLEMFATMYLCIVI